MEMCRLKKSSMPGSTKAKIFECNRSIVHDRLHSCTLLVENCVENASTSYLGRRIREDATNAYSAERR
jgi:hypothetical protein